MRIRTVLCLGVLGFVIAGLLSGNTRTSATPPAYRGPGVSWREVNIGHGQRCLPVALTAASLSRGLTGVRHVYEPLVFQPRAGQLASFWMRGVRVPLTGVWVSANGRVFGVWHGRPRSRTVHRSGRPVGLVLEYGPRERVPALGTRIAVTGLPCNMGPGL
jgi:uncharacterized membrane protein (UPF0127 family)